MLCRASAIRTLHRIRLPTPPITQLRSAPTQVVRRRSHQWTQLTQEENMAAVARADVEFSRAQLEGLLQRRFFFVQAFELYGGGL